MSDSVILKLDKVWKEFGSLVAVNDVSFEIKKKEIVALVGENGAGKSTVCKMITGVYQRDCGEISFNGKPVNFRSVRDSIAAGIGMVYQERNLVPLMTVAQNVCLNAEPTSAGMISEKRTLETARAIQEQLKTHVPLDKNVDELGAGEQQLVEIMRALVVQPQLLILDEPTASLGQGEVEPFLNFIKHLRDTLDIGVIFISHKLEEVFTLCDRIVVLTDGNLTLNGSTSEVTMHDCISAMMRSKELEPIVVPEKDFSKKEEILRCDTAKYDGKTHDLDIFIKRGEVVGFYGLVGSGRTEWAETLCGLRQAEEKHFVFAGETITKAGTREMLDRGMVLTPERRGNGMFREFSLKDNITNLFIGEKLSNKLGFVLRKQEVEFAMKVLTENKVKCRSWAQSIKELSGGNIQKVIIGRSVAIDGVKLLIADEPTTGMDVGAKNEVYMQMRSLADERDIAVAFISSELEELLSVCDRIYTFAQGSAVQYFERKSFDKAKILESAIRGKAV